jgi:hypothetical protein
MHRGNRESCSKLSRLSRFGHIVKQTGRNAPFIVALPCQSEIKRTLRPANCTSEDIGLAGIRAPPYQPFDPDGECPVSGADSYGFEMVMGAALHYWQKVVINRKFTPNRSNRVSLQIFGKLTSMETLAIYRRLLVSK